MSGTPQVLTVRVPLAIRQRGGRKIVITPEGAVGAPPQRARVDSALVKALARGYRWKRMLDGGQYTSISEIAASEKIDRGYVGSLLRLTLLAPDITEAILDGRQPEGLGLSALLARFPAEWDQQRVDCRVLPNRLLARRHTPTKGTEAGFTEPAEGRT